MILRNVIIVDALVFDVETVLLTCRLFLGLCNFDVKESDVHLEVYWESIHGSEIPIDFEVVFKNALLEQKVRNILDKKCSGMRDKIVEMAFSHFRR